jgi:hypothetical protein
MLPIKLQLINRILHIRQREMPRFFLETCLLDAE